MALNKDEHLGHRKQPDNSNKEIHPVKQMQTAAGKTCQASRFVNADHRDAKTKTDRNGCLRLIVRAKAAKCAEGKKIEGKIFRRAKQKGDSRQQRRQQHQPDGGQKRANK